MPRTTRVVVTIVKTIQLRTEWMDEHGKVEHGNNQRYRVPAIACEYWARQSNLAWAECMFEKYGNPVPWETADQRREKLYRRALPIFRAMLA